MSDASPGKPIRLWVRAVALGAGTVIIVAGILNPGIVTTVPVVVAAIIVVGFVITSHGGVIPLIRDWGQTWEHYTHYRKRRRLIRHTRRAVDRYLTHGTDEEIASRASRIQYLLAPQVEGVATADNSAGTKPKEAIDFFLDCLNADGEVRRLIRGCITSPDARVAYLAGLATFAEAWAKVHHQVMHDANQLHLIAALFRGYAQEEARHLDIDSDREKGRTVVVTSFPSYGGLVKEVIRAAIDQLEGDVVCFTTLSIPLTRWFNWLPFREVQECRIHPSWHDYTESLSVRELLSGQTPRIKLMRCLLSYEGTAADTLVRDLGLPFHPLSTIREHAQRAILVPLQGMKLSYRGVKALTPDEFNRLYPDKDNEICTQLRARYQSPMNAADDKDQVAYMIAPDASADIAQEFGRIDHYEWRPLGETFMQMFHSFDPAENLGYVVFDQHDIRTYFGDVEYHRKIPTDLFIVGLKKDGAATPEWLFCFAGEVDSDNNRVTLEFLSKKINKNRFVLVKDYIDILTRKMRTKPVKSLWEET